MHPPFSFTVTILGLYCITNIALLQEEVAFLSFLVVLVPVVVEKSVATVLYVLDIQQNQYLPATCRGRPCLSGKTATQRIATHRKHPKKDDTRLRRSDLRRRIHPASQAAAAATYGTHHKTSQPAGQPASLGRERLLDYYFLPHPPRENSNS